jgi:hypothetical protein
VVMHEDHAPPLEDLSPAMIAGGGHEPIRVGEGWREKRGHH